MRAPAARPGGASRRSATSCSSSCAKPSMAFSGVRSSWLMRARNSDLARLARSAASTSRAAPFGHGGAASVQFSPIHAAGWPARRAPRSRCWPASAPSRRPAHLELEGIRLEVLQVSAGMRRLRSAAPRGTGMCSSISWRGVVRRQAAQPVHLLFPRHRAGGDVALPDAESGQLRGQSQPLLLQLQGLARVLLRHVGWMPCSSAALMLVAVAAAPPSAACRHRTTRKLNSKLLWPPARARRRSSATRPRSSARTRAPSTAPAVLVAPWQAVDAEHLLVPAPRARCRPRPRSRCQMPTAGRIGNQVDAPHQRSRTLAFDDAVRSGPGRRRSGPRHAALRVALGSAARQQVGGSRWLSLRTRVSEIDHAGADGPARWRVPPAAGPRDGRARMSSSPRCPRQCR